MHVHLIISTLLLKIALTYAHLMVPFSMRLPCDWLQVGL